MLDCHGPFQVLNAIRNLLPDATHTIVVAFEPTQAKSVSLWMLTLTFAQSLYYFDRTDHKEV